MINLIDENANFKYHSNLNEASKSLNFPTIWPPSLFSDHRVLGKALSWMMPSKPNFQSSIPDKHAQDAPKVFGFKKPKNLTSLIQKDSIPQKEPTKKEFLNAKLPYFA